MRAAGEFVSKLGGKSLLLGVRRVRADLYGSLALNGRECGINRAVILGLCGEQPEMVDATSIEDRLRVIREAGGLLLRGVHYVGFREADDLISHQEQRLLDHSNEMYLRAFGDGAVLLLERVYLSSGDGCILREGEERDPPKVDAEPRSTP
jgi:L-serine dehydratase